MRDEDALFYELENGRRITLLALADLYEERGEAAISKGLRWLADTGHYPQPRFSGGGQNRVIHWKIYRGRRADHLVDLEDVYPFEDAIGGSWSEFRTEREAVLATAQGIGLALLKIEEKESE